MLRRPALALSRSDVAVVGVTALLAVLLFTLGPSWFDRGDLNEVGTLLLLLSVAQAWNLISGYGGQILLGVGAFVGTGGYVTTLVMIHSELTAIPVLVLAAASGVVLAALVAYPLFRMRGPYFAVGSLALTLAILAWMQNWDYSGGSQPIAVPYNRVPTPEGLFQMAVVLATIAMAIAWLVRRSDFGLRLMAVRDDEAAAEGSGVLTLRTKLVAFMLTGLIMGLAGGVSALQTTAIDPATSFGLGWTIDAIVMTVVGGFGTLLGPLVGTFVVYYGIQTQFQDAGSWSQLITGALLLLVIRFAPLGLWPLAQQLARSAWRTARGGTPPRSDDPAVGVPSVAEPAG